ncbi:hypothetical protein [Cellulosilyticum ruminicola]|nr:hypothetical protein [Cellulosilyticum ruminicola]
MNSCYKNKLNKYIWEASIEEVKRGFIEEDEAYKCIICEEEFEKGQV